MKLNKIVSVALIAAVCVSVLSACYSSEEKPVSIVDEMSSYETGSVTSRQPEAKYTASLTKEFQNWIPTQTNGFVYYISNGSTSLQIIKAGEMDNPTEADAVSYLKNDIDGNYVNVVYTEEAVDASLGGHAAKKSSYTGDIKGLYVGKSDELSLYTNTIYSVILGNEIYIARLLSPAGNYEKQKQTLNEIAASIQFTPVA